MTVRIRLPLPTTEESLPYAIAAGGHVVLFLFILGVIGPARGPAGGRPSMAVRLAPSAGPSVSSAPARTAPPARRPTPPAAAPVEKPPVRTQAAPKPKTPARELSGVTVQPDQLESAEPPPPAGPTAPAADAAPGPEVDAAQGPVAGGVAGLSTEELGGADWYVGLVVTRLQDAWRDRPVLPLGSSPMRTTVSFVIARTGQVSDARIETPSGYAPLDNSVLRAVLSLGRLPPLPSVYGKDELRAQFVFELTPATQ